MASKFQQWYKGRFEGFGQEPPDEVWSAISARLDDKKAEDQNRVKGILWFILSGGSLSLVFLGLLFQSVYVKPAIGTAGRIFTATGKGIHFESPRPQSTSEKSVSPVKEAKSPQIVEQISTSTGIIEAEENIIPSPTDITVESLVDSPQKQGETLQDIPEQLTASIPVQEGHFSFNRKVAPAYSIGRIPVHHGLYIGITGILSNTWLLGNDTYYALRGTTLNSLRTGVKPSFILQANYRFSKYFSAAAEYTLYQGEGMRYLDYQYGKVVPRDIRFSYTGLNVLSYYNRPLGKGFNNKVGELQVGLGAGVSYLTHADVTISGQPKDVTDFRKTNISVIAELAYQVPVSRHFHFKLSARANSGIINLYKGNDQTPAYFHSTHTLSYGLGASLIYRFDFFK